MKPLSCLFSQFFPNMLNDYHILFFIRYVMQLSRQHAGDTTNKKGEINAAETSVTPAESIRRSIWGLP